MAAASSLFCVLLPGDHVVAPRIMYGGLRKWLSEFALSWGVAITWADATDMAAVGAAVRAGRTRLVWIETPANATWEVTDVAAAAEVAHEAHALLAVDSPVRPPRAARIGRSGSPSPPSAADDRPLRLRPPASRRHVDRLSTGRRAAVRP
ncbi:MAG: PLP-dependent transferase [Actinobacteria bacterium]|nr:PLP-dependent transferase [Actinomycetota bacterium]